MSSGSSKGRLAMLLKGSDYNRYPRVTNWSTQSQPNGAGTCTRRKIARVRRAMKIAGALRYLQAIPRHEFKGPFAQPEAIGRKQDVSIAIRHLQGGKQEVFKIAFDLEPFSTVRPRESGWIENDHVEFFALAREPGQDGQDVIRDEMMFRRR